MDVIGFREWDFSHCLPEAGEMVKVAEQIVLNPSLLGSGRVNALYSSIRKGEDGAIAYAIAAGLSGDAAEMELAVKCAEGLPYVLASCVIAAILEAAALCAPHLSIGKRYSEQTRRLLAMKVLVAVSQILAPLEIMSLMGLLTDAEALNLLQLIGKMKQTAKGCPFASRP